MTSALANSAQRGPVDSTLLDCTIGQEFDRIAAMYPDRDALIVRHQQIRWTYSEYRDNVDRLAAGLLAIGAEPGDRVGIWSPNCAEWSVTQFATAKIGAILVCINPAYGLHELEYALNKVQCKVLITAESFKASHYLSMLEELAPELADNNGKVLSANKLPHLRTVIRMGETASPGMLSYSSVLDAGSADDHARVRTIGETLSSADPINIQFTSGTTGSPKGATLTHHNILNNGKLVGDGMRFSEKDRLCIPVPLYHCFGMVLGNLVCITHGAAAVYPDAGFDPETTLAAVSEERCTALHGVPTMFIGELDHPRFSEFDLGSLRTGIMAGSPCPIEVMNRVITEMHMREILIGYGQTETSPINHMTAAEDPIEKRVGTVGQPAPHCEIKIVDGHGNVVPIGEKGEICCRGYAVMQGYWDDEARTAETIDAQGWLHSGDIGVMDAQGFTQVTGRIKDMIIRGGENVYPREIEEFLYSHPAILEVQVFGVPDARLGEHVCAWIKLKEQQTLDEDGVRAFCANRIAHFKIPHFIRFVDEFPMTVTGKIQKFVMRERMILELDLAPPTSAAHLGAAG